MCVWQCVWLVEAQDHDSFSSLFTAMGKKLCLSPFVQVHMTLSLPEVAILDTEFKGWWRNSDIPSSDFFVQIELL